MDKLKQDLSNELITTLRSKLWGIADILRNKVNASEYKNYALGLIFYKFLSDKFYNKVNYILSLEDDLEIKDYKDLDINNEYYIALEEEIPKELGYFIKKEHLFSSLIDLCKRKENVITVLQDALNSFENSININKKDAFRGLFSTIDLRSDVLGATDVDRNLVISEVLQELNAIDIDVKDKIISLVGANEYDKYKHLDLDILGDAYEYLIGEFSLESVKDSGQHYTPQAVSKILASIVTINNKDIKTAYDPTCGSGSLLLQINKICENNGNNNLIIYGQEINNTAFNLARMNMILHGIKFINFNLQYADTLKNPKFDEKFDAIVANPPFSAKVDFQNLKENNYDTSVYETLGGFAPKSSADYAFVQHMYSKLNKNGTIAVVLPHGTLFRGGAEENIRRFFIENLNAIDAIIGLPANIFFGTGIPTCIMVLKKNRENKDILFIDASLEFEKGKKQNKLLDNHIQKIIDTYKDRKEVENYSHIASYEEIVENDFNLNIPRYIDNTEEEEIISLDDIANELYNISKEMQSIDAEIDGFCKELGIKSLSL